MRTAIMHEIKKVRGKINYMPSVTVILPFEPKMSSKSSLHISVKAAYEKAELELEKKYPGEMSSLVMQKLRSIFDDLNFNTHKKSIAVFVSPVFQKILYLDIAVEQNIIIDESFEIRDLVYCKKQIHKYLVLLMSEKQSRIFLGNSDSFLQIVSNSSESVNACINDVPEIVANFSDFTKRNEIIMDKFIHHIDNGLNIILNAYHLPLFVIGTKKIMGHFKKITKHSGSVIEYIHGNYDESSLKEIRDILEPHITNWKKVKQKDFLNQLEDAENNKKLAVGMRSVWKAAMNHKGRLLLVEKNYMYAAQFPPGEMIKKETGTYNKFSYIKDAVDEVIEKVLESGGDVEFAEAGLLKAYEHIVLIQHY